MKIKIAVAFAAVLFLVLAGTTVSSALWSASNKVSTTVKVATLADSCVNVTSMLNASFEKPVITSTLQTIKNPGVEGWRTTDPEGIEVWRGYAGIPAGVGSQFVELNASQAGTLSQQLTTTPGQTLQWSLLHRAREGKDTMNLWIGAPGAGVLQRVITDDTTAWVRYSGTYVVPVSQTITELSFETGTTGSGNPSIGNFLDDVSFGSGPCLEATSTVANITSPSGDVNPGHMLEYTTTVENIGSALASNTALRWVLPANLSYVAGSVKVAGVTQTGAAGLNKADYATGTRVLSARLGSGATDTAGGIVAQQTSTTFSYRATVNAGVAAAAVIDYAPVVGYTNALAVTWPLSVAADNAPVTVRVANADLAVAARVDTATTQVGTASSRVWSFAITNNGPATATGVMARVTMPTFLTGTGNGFGTTGVACALVVAGEYDCTVTGANQASGTLTSGQSRTITLTRTIPSSLPYGSTITVASTVRSSVADPVLTNNTAGANVSQTLSSTAVHKVANPATNDCVDAYNGQTNEYTPLTVFTCGRNPVSQQGWTISTNTDASVRFKSTQVNLWWEPRGTAAGSEITLQQSETTNIQRWDLVSQGDGTVLIKNKSTGTCVDRINNWTGSYVKIATCDPASVSQRFAITVWP